MNFPSSRLLPAPQREQPNACTPRNPYRHGCDPPVSQINPPHLFPNIPAIIVTTLLNFALFFFSTFSSSAAEEPDTSTPANDKLTPLLIQLNQGLHFDAPDGQSVAVLPGMYLVEPSILKEPQLILWHEHGTVTLQATRTTHDQGVKTPEAYLIQENENEDIHHVVAFIPDGTALEAIGSISGIQSRGNFRVTQHYQLDAATGVVQFGQGQQGRRLPTGQPDISTQYRKGIGSQGSAMDMIQLQSIISQRQTALALTTNLLNTLNGRFQFEEGTDRPGNDYARNMEDSPKSCRTRCAGDENCQAFTFVKPNPGSAQGQCFLKRSEPQPVTNRCCVSGTRSSTQDKIIRNIGG